jgi:RNA polymerase sigma-70 factor (ECF subfamily)
MRTDLRAALLAVMPRLRRFGIALTGSKDEADDLVQDVCERVLCRGDQLRDQARLDAWLYGIMRHLWLDKVRSRGRRRSEELSAADTVAGHDGRRITEATLTLAAVREALGSLSEEHRSVLVLVCVDGLSYREASEVLGIPQGTVMSRLSRGRQELSARVNARATPGRVTAFPARIRCGQMTGS